MNQYYSQEEVRRIIISDMVKKRNFIVPVIGEDTIVYKDEGTGKENPFQEFILSEFQKKYPRVAVDDDALTSMKERGYYGLSLMSQYYERRFLDDFMDFVNDNRSCFKLKDEVLDFLVTCKYGERNRFIKNKCKRLWQSVNCMFTRQQVFSFIIRRHALCVGD